MSLHLDHTGLELHESAADRVQDGIASDLRTRARNDTGHAE
jgi:hypothetical protein